MKRFFYWVPVLLLILACKTKRTSLTDDDTIDAADFVEFFPETSLPFQVADTSLPAKPTDSLTIGYKIFTQFIPDSILQKDFGKKVQPKLYALGKVQEKKKETYLFIKAVHGKKQVAYLACFNRKDSFMNAMPLVKNGGTGYSTAYGLVDDKYQITTYWERKRRGVTRYKKNVFFLNNASNDFTLIMTEPNEDIIEHVINPIDTLSKNHKYAGDYVQNSRNFVSVRDGKNSSEIQFFIHFEKDNGNCTGELKGSARFISEKVAQYNESGNPCTIQLSFTGSRVTMKETAGCGTYRDIRCFFEGSFRKPEVKSLRLIK